MIRTNTKSATNTYIIIFFIFSLVIITKRVEIAMMIIGESNCEGRNLDRNRDEQSRENKITTESSILEEFDGR